MILALDQGTSSSRALLFDEQGRLVAQAQEEVRAHYPQPGWVEQDPLELWATQQRTARRVLQHAQVRLAQVAAVGITNQRETTVLWNRATGQPLHAAIVWQDRRTEPLCAELRARGFSERVSQRTGLVIDPYFSATKLRWLLDHLPGAQAAAERGELAFGTVDSWLLWNLTGGAVHATDVSNASRTLLWNLHLQDWDEELLRRLNIPRAVLPQVRPSCAHFGEVAPGVLEETGDGAPGTRHTHRAKRPPITGIAGDQQAALAGQACFTPGLAKNTYGTGCFALVHTGHTARRSTHGLLTTAAASPTADRAGATPTYALEGSVFVGGAVVQWLRDGLGVVGSSHEAQRLADSVPDSGGVTFVPAFTGLGAPYWDADARGALFGLTRGSTAAHIARAAVDSMAYQSTALLQAMNADLLSAGSDPLLELRVDGGACVNDRLMQLQADLLGLPVLRPAITETTALGAAYLAGVGAGLWRGADDVAQLWRVERRFEPSWSADQREQAMANWEAMVARVRS